MTKISCTECRERLGELLAEEVAAVHAGSNGSTSSDIALLRAHVNECPECADSLKVLRAARETMQGFAPLAAPQDLRARIRAQIEMEPTAQTPMQAGDETSSLSTETLRTPEEALTIMSGSSAVGQARREAPAFVPVVPYLPVRKNPFSPRYLRREVVRFFKNPSNIAWTSGVAIAFCVILVIRPRPETATQYQTPAPVSESAGLKNRTVYESNGAAGKSAAKTDAKVTVKPIGTPVPNALPGVPKIAPIPGLPTTPDNRYPFTFPSSGASSPEFPEETATLPEPSPNTPGTNAPAPKPAAVPSKPVSPPNTSQSGSSSGQASLPSSTGAKIAADRYNSSTSDAASPTTRSRRERDADSAQLFAKSQSSEAMSSEAAGATGAAGPQGPARMMRAPAASSEMRREPAMPVTRFINTQIIPRRDVNWGQVSVVLSGGATFDGGGKARVIWRGSASAEEPIELGFSVSGARGQYSAQLVLQEVRGGEAQTVSSRSVPVNLR